MSASIHSLLADELDISEEKAEKLLSAMLREVRKRARQGQKGVRLPDLGKFVVEDGDLAFYPDDSLRRAVNHRFEGLDSEDLSSAPTSGKTDEAESEGPSTIRLGYQEEGWSPIGTDVSEEPAGSSSSADPSPTEDEPPQDEPSKDQSSEEDGADTEEFQPPAAESADDPAPSDPAPEESATPRVDEEDAESPPTEEVSRPSSDASDPTEPEPSPETTDSPESAGAQQTEELYPLVDEMGSDPPAEGGHDAGASPERSRPTPDDAPDESAQTEAEEASSDDERDALSEIWNDDSDDEEDASDSDTDSVFEEATSALDSPPESDDPEPTQVEASAPADERETDAWDVDPSDETSASSDESSSEEDTTEQTPPRTAPEPSRPGQPTGASIPRVLVSILVLLLLGGGAWYILGQRGLVPSPGQTIAEFSSPGASTGPSDADTAPSDEGDAPSSSTDGTSTQEAPSSSEADSEASEPSAAAPSEGGLDLSAGGWTVVVASRSDQRAATDLVSTYRERFADREVPVDLIEGTVDGETRYRVGVGQFPSQIEAETFLDANDASLPEGAWPLELE